MELQRILERPKLPVFADFAGQFIVTRVLACIALALIHCPLLIGQEAGKKNSGDSRLFAKLSAPMTSVVDGRSFREGMTRIANSVGVNLWIDRHVDPSRTINSGQLGPTAYLALKKLAEDHGCVVMPIRSVVLVGKEDWVDTVVASLARIPSRSEEAAIDVAWPRLSTPDEAIKAVHSELGSDQDGTWDGCLDYGADSSAGDLWPAATWKTIESDVAIVLIALQMADRDRALPKHKKSLALRRRKAVDLKLTRAAAKVKNSNSLDAVFSLNTQTRAASVLSQLCGAAHLKCVIDPGAVESCNQIVSISESDVTLRQLIETVAGKAGVVPRWQASAVVFVAVR